MTKTAVSKQMFQNQGAVSEHKAGAPPLSSGPWPPGPPKAAGSEQNGICNAPGGQLYQGALTQTQRSFVRLSLPHLEFHSKKSYGILDLGLPSCIYLDYVELIPKDDTKYRRQTYE